MPLTCVEKMLQTSFHLQKICQGQLSVQWVQQSVSAWNLPQKQTPQWLLMTSKEVWTLSRLYLQPNTAYKGISNRLTATVDYVSEGQPTQLFTYLGVEKFKLANCRSFLVQAKLYSSDTSIWEAQLGSDV